MITLIHDYDSFEKYLETETIEKYLPGIDTIEDSCKIYYNYFTKEDESKYKIRAIRLKVIKV